MSQTRFLCATPLLYAKRAICLIPTNADVGLRIDDVDVHKHIP
jgi:hypothetical protein